MSWLSDVFDGDMPWDSRDGDPETTPTAPTPTPTTSSWSPPATPEVVTPITYAPSARGSTSPTSAEALAMLNSSMNSATIPADLLNPASSAAVDGLLNKAESAYDSINMANAASLRGEVSDDVWAQIEQQTAESGALQGFGVGSMTGKKTARDLGLTSMQIQQQGIQTQAALGSAYTGLGQARETMRQYDSAFQQSSEKLRQSARQQALAGTVASLEYSQFRSSLTNEINTMITDLTQFGVQTQAALVANGNEDEYGDMHGRIENLITQYSEILGGM